MSHRWINRIVGFVVGMLLAGVIAACMTVPQDVTIKVELVPEDRARIDALNGNLKHLSRSTDATLKAFGVPVDNAPAEDD